MAGRAGFLSVLLFAACVSRELREADLVFVQQPVGKTWAPPEPDAQEWDWIKLNTGEWLKGDLKSMRNESFEFDSDKLKDQTFKWKDVHEFRSARRNTVVLRDRSIVTGTVHLKDGVVVMKTEEGDRRIERSKVLSIVQEGDRELSLWSGKVSFGLTARTGNTDQVETNTQIILRRSTAFSRIDLNYIANFGELQGATNVDNQRFDGRWNLYLSRRLYLTPLALAAYRDPFQNIAVQLTPGFGAGYAVVDTDDLDWDVELGFGWRTTKFETVEPGTPESEDTAAIIPGTRFHWDITSDIELSFSYSIQVGVPDTDDTIEHTLLGLSVDLFEDLDLEVTVQWDRVGKPRPAADGTIPNKNDFRFVVGLAWKF